MKRFLSILFFLGMGQALFAQLRLPALFADNMVLQQQVANKVWGWALPSETVSIRFLNKDYAAKADHSGQWSVTLSPAPAFTKTDMVITAGMQKISISNIIFGEIWVCGGQSNMEYTMGDVSSTYPEEITSANNENIRFIVVDHKISNKEESSFSTSATNGWQTINQENVKRCSAIGYFFAKKINQRLRVPVGLIVNPWGGTTQQAWMPAEALEHFPAYKAVYERDILPLNLDALDDHARRIEKQYASDKAASYPAFAASLQPGYDDAAWDDFELPKQWEENGYPEIDGLAAFRIRVVLTEADIQHDAVLHFPAIDDADSTFVNGQFVGTLHAWNEKRVYNIPKAFLKPGENIIQVKVEDTGGGGGFSEDADNFYLLVKFGNESRRIRLSGRAKFRFLARLGTISGNVTLGNLKNQPSVLFNGMMAPLLNYSIRGFIWYQGESNVSMHDEFRSLFPSFIRSIRKRWGIGDFPFLFVQLSSYNPSLKEPEISNWAELRDAQSSALKLSNTAMAVSYDVGDLADIHPQRKKEPGERLAAAALKTVYQTGNEIYSGPAFSKFTVNGKNSISIYFKNAGTGLVSKTPVLNGFEISYNGINFLPAKATIFGKRVQIACNGMPAVIRYAWGNAPMHAGLMNREGFPALPFRVSIQ